MTILLAAPRGFCAGVDRAIKIVERALTRFGPPVYVRHEIVHNQAVVRRLQAMGAVFVEELDEVPDGAPVIFSAHGVPKSVPAEAGRRGLVHLDATCPLVTKVHNGAQQHHRAGRRIILIGHAGHPEVIGTMGQTPEGTMILVQNVAEAEAVMPDTPDNLAFVTQTTLSVDETAEIIAVLKRRFPAIQAPRREDICYATTNRQEAVKAVAARADAVLVVGAANSSNSRRLVEVALRAGCPRATLIRDADDIDWKALEGARTLGLSAGASAPEDLVEEVITAACARFKVSVEDVAVTQETMTFKLPALLADQPPA